jgi:hypothetical protein
MRYRLCTLLIAVTLTAICLAYVGNYVSRSVRGCYKPSAIGLGGVKWYSWAPEGFVTGYDWNIAIWRFYYPAWYLDERFWHQPVQGKGDTAYAIDEVPGDEIGKVYRAWGAFADRPSIK